jgi:hypothetical protein
MSIERVIGNECREMYSAMPAQRVETRHVGDRVEKGITPGESQAIVFNAVELGRFGTDELRGWSGDTTVRMKGWYCREGKTNMISARKGAAGAPKWSFRAQHAFPPYTGNITFPSLTYRY